MENAADSRTACVALAQIPVTADKKQNIKTAEEYVRRAAQQGAEIVMLPEMFCCPYENRSFAENAEREGGFVWQSLSRMAAENHVLLIGGSMPERDGKQLYNTCFVFDSAGREIGKHRKVHLFDIGVTGGQSFSESSTFSRGRKVTVIDTEFGRIGIEICFDIRFTELTHLMALEGAEMIFVPGAFNMTTGPAHWELHFRARALDSQVYMFGCSPARDESASYRAYGHSIITSPWGDVVAELDEKAGILLRKIDRSQVSRIREQLPILAARRTNVYRLMRADDGGKPRVFFDMDGVLADFDRGVRELCHMEPIVQGSGEKNDDRLWAAVREVPHFYDRLEPVPGAVELFRKVHERYGSRCQILTGVPKPRRRIADAGTDKVRWVKRILGEDVRVNVVFREQKPEFCAGRQDVLIDDYKKNIREWESFGGTGILFHSAEQAEAALNSMPGAGEG